MRRHCLRISRPTTAQTTHSERLRISAFAPKVVFVFGSSYRRGGSSLMLEPCSLGKHGTKVGISCELTKEKLKKVIAEWQNGIISPPT